MVTPPPVAASRRSGREVGTQCQGWYLAAVTSAWSDFPLSVRVALGVKLTFMVIQVGVDADEVKVCEPFLRGRFQFDQAAPRLGRDQPKNQKPGRSQVLVGVSD